MGADSPGHAPRACTCPVRGTQRSRALVVSSAAVYAAVTAGVFSVAVWHAARAGYALGTDWRLPWTVVYAAGFVVAAYSLGLPDAAKRRSVPVLAAASCLAAFGGFSVISAMAGTALLPRLVHFGAPPLVFCLLSGGSILTLRVAALPSRVVLVGGSANDRAELALDIAGAGAGAEIAEISAEDLGGLSARRDMTVVLCEQPPLSADLLADAASLQSSGIPVRTILGFYNDRLGQWPVHRTDAQALLFDVAEVHRPWYPRLKRLGDLGAAVVLLVPFLVAVPFVAAANVVGSRGPLFFRQARVGKNGDIFQIWKFRTMTVAAAPADGRSEWTVENDPRVTKVGRLLRASHLDELPQTFNLLRGDLSLVGPRPEQPGYVADLVREVPHYPLRHLVRPGLTGWAQVNGGYVADIEGTARKLAFDLYYLQHQSLLFDARIVARTARSVLGRDGR